MAKTLEECRKSHPQCWVATVEGVGDFVYRKPTSREWMEYDAARVAFTTALGSANVGKAQTREWLSECEDLCKRVVVSHTAEELQAIEDDVLGLFRDLAPMITETVDALRVRSGKGSVTSGAASAEAKSPNA